MLKVVKLQSLIAKCCQNEENIALRNVQILYLFALRTGNCTTFGANVVHFPACNQGRRKNKKVGGGPWFRGAPKNFPPEMLATGGAGP
jgi:hypothetical protein